MFQSRMTLPEDLWKFVHISLELLFGFTMIVLLAELSEGLGTLSFVGWALTFILAFIFVLLDYNVRRIQYFINRELTIRISGAYLRRDILITSGVIILVPFLALGYWVLGNLIYIYKACIVIFCWMVFPIVSGAITSHILREVAGERMI